MNYSQRKLRAKIQVLFLGVTALCSTSLALGSTKGFPIAEKIPIRFDLVLQNSENGELNMGSVSAALVIYPSPFINADPSATQEDLDADILLYSGDQEHRIPVELKRESWTQIQRAVLYSRSQSGVTLKLALRNLEDLLKIIQLTPKPWYRKGSRKRELLRKLTQCPTPSGDCKISDCNGQDAPWTIENEFNVQFQISRVNTNSESLFISFPRRSERTQNSSIRIHLPGAFQTLKVTLSFL